MAIVIVTLIGWMIYALLEGKRDGYFYHYRNTSIQLKDENIHWVYFIDRAFMLSLISVLGYYYFHSYLITGIYSGGLALIFSFLHNGIYYQTRKKLSNGNLYSMGWRSSSTCSKATLEFGWNARVILAIIGALGIIISFTINL